MATAYKVLGQSAPAATTDTNLYTCPASTEAVVSTIAVCNRGSSAGQVRVFVRPDGASVANQHYIVYDASVAANDTIFVTIGATMDAADVLSVRASSANFSFTAFGSEIS
jgi:hypothetical protein